MLFKTCTHDFNFIWHIAVRAYDSRYIWQHTFPLIRPVTFYTHITVRHSHNTLTCSIRFKGLSLPFFLFFFTQLCACFILSHPEALCLLSSLRMKKYERHELCREFRKIAITTLFPAVFMASYTGRTTEKILNLGQFFQLCTIQYVAVGKLEDSLCMSSNNEAIPV